MKDLKHREKYGDFRHPKRHAHKRRKEVTYSHIFVEQ